MPTLLLTPRQTEDAQALWRGCVELGWKVHRLHGWKVPDVDNADVVVYAEPLLATRIADALGIELLDTTSDWLPSLPERWRGRSVQLMTINQARECAEPRFIKSAVGKEFDARAYDSGKRLPRGELIGDSLPVLVQEIVQWDVEYRCFVCDRTVKVASSYWRYGKNPCDENGAWSSDELDEAVDFCGRFLADPDVRVPDACVVDVGLIRGKRWAVIESNAAWSSGIYGCHAAAVLPVLQRACIPKV